MTPRKPPKQYMIYVGRDREFPKGQVVKHGKIYETEIIQPDANFSYPRMYVHAPKWSIYIPYSSVLAMWEDWFPYDGMVRNVQPKA